MKLEQFCHINPTEQLCKNVEYDFVEMSDIVPGKRYVFSKSKKRFNGSFSKFSNKDTLMAKITPCLENGKISQFIGSDNAFGSTEFNIFREKKDISDNDYLYYLISSPMVKEPAIKSMSGATGRQRANLDEIKQIEVPNISIEKQQKIARILSNYDDLIENNNRRIKILEEIAQKIYKEWFVDFKFPGHENTTFKDSPLGKIPNDWKVGIIKDINDVKGGYAFKSKDLKENGKFGIIKIKNIQAGNIDTNMCQYIDEKLAQKASDFKLNAGDILIAMTGAQVGKVGIMPQTKQVYYLNQRVAKFIPNKDFIINNQYLAIYTQTEKFNIQINNIASGAAQPNISASQIENIEILVPKAEIISAFENFINPNLKEAQILKNKNENLKHTRDILLPRLISGEIDVENMEIK